MCRITYVLLGCHTLYMYCVRFLQQSEVKTYRWKPFVNKVSSGVIRLLVPAPPSSLLSSFLLR